MTHRFDFDSLLRRLLGAQVEAQHLLGQVPHHRGTVSEGREGMKASYQHNGFIVKKQISRDIH